MTRNWRLRAFMPVFMLIASFNMGLANAETTEIPPDTGVIGFMAPAVEYPAVPQGEIITHDFDFKNNGSGPLSITGATTRTPNTSISYSAQSVPVGAYSLVRAKIDTSSMSGPQAIRFQVTSDALNDASTLYLYVEVLEGENDTNAEAEEPVSDDVAVDDAEIETEVVIETDASEQVSEDEVEA